MVLQQIGKTGGILSNNWVGNTYQNRHFKRAIGPKLKKAELEDDPSKFHYPGAIIGDPTLNDFPHLVYNIFDLDYGAEYPSCIVLNNLFPDTIQFKIWVDPSQFKDGLCINNGIGANHDPDDIQSDYADAIFGDYISNNHIAFVHTWFGAPDIDQIYANILRRREEGSGIVL